MADDNPVPASGSADPADTEIVPGEEPWIPGTIFLTTLMFIAIVGSWIMMYFMLLRR